MAVTVSDLVHNSAAGSITSQATASFTPSANNLVLAAVSSRTGISTEPNQPTISGNSLTWVALASGLYFDTTSSSRKKLTVFRAMGASPTAGAATIDFASQTQTDVLWSFFQFSGVDTSGTNGSGAVGGSLGTNIASTIQDGGNGGSGGSITATLSSFSNANNVTLGIYTTDTVSASAGSGFSVVSNFNDGTSISLLTEWQNANQTSVTASCPSAAGTSAAIFAVEINAAPVVSTVNLGTSRLLFGVGS